MPSEHIPLSLRRVVGLRARGLRDYCHSQAGLAMQAFSIVHVVPRSQQGTTELENLAISPFTYPPTIRYEPKTRERTKIVLGGRATYQQYKDLQPESDFLGAHS